jgi:hypothetical protein
MVHYAHHVSALGNVSENIMAHQISCETKRANILRSCGVSLIS